jgi:hypothetical protein
MLVYEALGTERFSEPLLRFAICRLKLLVYEALGY